MQVNYDKKANAETIKFATDELNKVEAGFGDGKPVVFNQKKMKQALAKKGVHSVRVFKVGRNEPCPCGSGVKYKKCCLRGK